MADGGIGSWVVGPERLVGSEPALKDAGEEREGTESHYIYIIYYSVPRAPLDLILLTFFCHLFSLCSSLQTQLGIRCTNVML